MGVTYLHSPPAANLVREESALLRSISCCHNSYWCLRCNSSNLKPCRTLAVNLPLRYFNRRVAALPDVDDFFWEKDPTPILDTIDAPIHLKNLSSKELKQLAGEVRSEISFIMSRKCQPCNTGHSVVELAIAIHYVFNAPMDKILWDAGQHTYAHKILTGRRSLFHTIKQRKGLSGFTSRFESEYDPFGAGHGCNSLSAGLGMAVARDLGGRKNRIVTVISNWTTMAGQVYEAMGHAGFLDSNMVVILNDSRHTLLPKADSQPKMSINAFSSALSKVQSSKGFRKFREAAKGLSKWFGKGMHEFAAKIDEYARGMIGPHGATLFEELGLYYIGPIDGNNIDDLICVLKEVATLDSTGPVLVHVITENEKDSGGDFSSEITPNEEGPPESSQDIRKFLENGLSRTYNDCFVESLIAEAENDKRIVVVHGGMGIDRSIQLFQSRFPDRFFDLGIAEQHAVTFSAGLACGGLNPFCIIPSTFLQRAYDQIVEDVDMQKIPVRFAITSAGLVGSEGPTNSGPFDITFMSCLPNMIVMSPSNEDELIDMVATAAMVEDRPICFRYPRGAIVGTGGTLAYGNPLEIGKGEILAEGKEIAFLGYGEVVQRCLIARSLLFNFGIQATVANARFCKPLDIDLIRMLCQQHDFLITVEEGTVGGFGSHVSQFISLDGLLDGKIKWRPIVLPDRYIEHASLAEQLDMAGLTAHHIAATALTLLGRHRDALLLMK
ncbi:probable 1-deoxy-D-xylulose-5-phosphate synthase, chloroplastic isoform X1 [Oryza brachyantha]|uniref:1-deoxy-D-xylulose-5-phosphate synthase n=2 Tax=Oryza brachyantha TaxID=4533 RepID=J3MB62_ORYBR|nr:probable 1-deoxy-D-xylulose-5-phosphate synthase, chloroplastic isoform X1 [Oryza brachyantha]